MVTYDVLEAVVDFAILAIGCRFRAWEADRRSSPWAKFAGSGFGWEYWTFLEEILWESMGWAGWVRVIASSANPCVGGKDVSAGPNVISVSV